jgi:acyl phosphate:glycerol-3-phosphate acyltransferase
MLAYLLGGLPFGYWFVRLTSGDDIRQLGSGNIGATNVHRAKGGKAGLIVLLLDIAKGWLAVWIAAYTTGGDPLAEALAAAAVLVGHCYPVFLRFRGGKAVACFIGAFGFLAPGVLLATLAVFVLVVAVTRYISLGSMAGVCVFPLLWVWMVHPPLPLLAAAVSAALLIVYRHRANIQRLRLGTEHTFSLKGKTA